MITDHSECHVSFGKRIDFHTHILPEMDDGSTSVDMSMQMIQASVQQGVIGIFLTPHFYPTRDNPEHFLKKRKLRFEQLKSNYQKETPRLIAGAEVAYFEGITAMQELPQMRMGNTSALLIEMPMNQWSNRMLNDIAELNRKNEYQVVLAHINRYLSFGNLPAIRQLASLGVKMQVNAEAFIGMWNSRKALHLLDEGLVHVLGSDCHNMSSRSPNLSDAYDYIERKRGTEAVQSIINNGLHLLSS